MVDDDTMGSINKNLFKNQSNSYSTIQYYHELEIVINNDYNVPNLIDVLHKLKNKLTGIFLFSDEGWDKLNNRWAFFFIFLALLNEIIWRTQSEQVWVNFKVWGILPLTFLFTVWQILIINKYKI